MSVKMSKSRRMLFIATLILSNIVVMGDNLLYPITANIYGEFYDQSMGVINYVVSGPLLIIFLVSFLVPALLTKISQKTALIIAGVMFAVSTIFGAAVPNIYYMAGMRTLTGISQGIVSVAAMSLLARVYTDDMQRGAVMGWSNSSMGVIGAIFAMLSGFLAVSGWRNAYLGYLASLPMLVMFVLFLPGKNAWADSENTAEDAAGPAQGAGEKKRFPLVFWMSIICFFLVVLAFNMMTYYVSFYVAEHQLGNESMSGMASTMVTVGSIIFCVIFGQIYKWLKIQTMTFACILLAAGLALLYFLPGLPLTFVALVLVGGSYGVGQTFCYTAGAQMAPEGKVDSAMGMVTAVYAIGGFAATYVSTWLMNIMHTDGAITPTLIVPMILMVIVSVLFPFASKAGGK